MALVRRVSFDTKGMEIKSKGGEEDAGQFVGYASTFGNWDDVWPMPERPVKGAFLKHLPKFVKRGFIAAHHQWGANPVAMVKDADEDDYGLLLEADFHSTQAAQDVRTIMSERLQAGKSVGLSIGYIVLEDEYVEEGRLLKEIELFETSFVNVPANPKADATMVKDREALAGLSFDTHIETVLEAVKDVQTRSRQILALREQKGKRSLGADAKSRMEGLIEQLNTCQGQLKELLTETDTKAVDGAAILAAKLNLARVEARLNGVDV
jgi:HK97 family phage prohead protease